MKWKVGDELPVLTKGPITRQHLVEWCAAENDYYDLHFDERQVARLGLDGSPVQGTYKLALLGALVERWARGSGVLRRLSIAYRRPDLEPATLRLGGRIAAIEPDGTGQRVEIDLWVENAAGERTADGGATVLTTATAG